MSEWTQEDLNRVCVAWQRELLIEHWTVRLDFRRREVLDYREGRINIVAARCEASIEILDQRDRCENPDFPYDNERVIVHELLHIVLDDITEDVATLREEQTIHNLSRTLTNLKRFFNDD
jgi:hypothetical protein